MMQSVGIFGFGRFGKTLARLLQDDFTIRVYDAAPIPPTESVTIVSQDVLLQEKVIFIAVPIRQFAATIQEIASTVNPHATIIDVCSVKVHPVTVMQQYLPDHIGIIATHPLFGPDSFAINDSQQPLKIMMHSVRDTQQCYSDWYDFFTQKNMHIIEQTPAEHDREAAFSQGITHFLGRALHDMGLQSTAIDTLGFEKLMSIVEQTCNDTWELFLDLQRFNPYTQSALDALQQSVQQLSNKIRGTSA